MCTLQYEPVCASKDGEERTYGNSCTANADEALVLYEGECKEPIKESAAPPEPEQTIEEALAATGTSASDVTVKSFFTRLWTYFLARLGSLF